MTVVPQRPGPASIREPELAHPRPRVLLLVGVGAAGLVPPLLSDAVTTTPLLGAAWSPATAFAVAVAGWLLLTTVVSQARETKGRAGRVALPAAAVGVILFAVCSVTGWEPTAASFVAINVAGAALLVGQATRPSWTVSPTESAEPWTTRGPKRLLDLTVASLLLVTLAPLMGFLAWRVWSHDRGTIIFSQTRIGHRGSTFRCLKFRTMAADAEDRLEALRDQSCVDVLFKLRADPRVTAPGRWMRRYSLDELPQLINVLRGEMSLVGPRPALPHEVQYYTPAVRKRLDVLPGLTGLWQVSGRSDLSFEEGVRCDLQYVDTRSMRLDLVILFRTISVVLGARGAY